MIYLDLIKTDYLELTDSMIQAEVNRAFSYLNHDPLLHTGMIEALRRNQAELLYAEKDGVLLKEKRSGAYMLSVSDADAGSRLIDTVEDAELFLAHQKFCLPFLKNRIKHKNIFDCLQAVYTSKNSLPLSNRFDISVLSEEYVNEVLTHYRTMENAEYIRGRIENREMFGAFSSGVLVGFIGLHDEGSIGLLEVLPEYRRLGVGSLLESYMINNQLHKGWTPFCQVLENNKASLSLQLKLGLNLSKEHLYWLF